MLAPWLRALVPAVALFLSGVAVAGEPEETPPPIGGQPLPPQPQPEDEPVTPVPEPIPAPRPGKRERRDPAKTFPHGGQFGIYTQFGVGYRAIFRYDENDFCGKAGSGVCTGATPPWVELGLDYAVNDKVELLFDIRLGLGEDFKPETSLVKAPHQTVLAPGVKIYMDESGAVKLFTTFQLAIDRTDYAANGVGKETDLGLRNVNGLLIDVHRTFGIYVHVGETFMFLRWLTLEMDVGIGLQARFP